MPPRRCMKLWRDELLAWFDEPIANGWAEGAINRIAIISEGCMDRRASTTFEPASS